MLQLVKFRPDGSQHMLGQKNFPTACRQVSNQNPNFLGIITILGDSDFLCCSKLSNVLDPNSNSAGVDGDHGLLWLLLGISHSFRLQLQFHLLRVPLRIIFAEIRPQSVQMQHGFIHLLSFIYLCIYVCTLFFYSFVYLFKLELSNTFQPQEL